MAHILGGLKLSRAFADFITIQRHNVIFDQEIDCEVGIGIDFLASLAF